MNERMMSEAEQKQAIFVNTVCAGSVSSPPPPSLSLSLSLSLTLLSPPPRQRRVTRGTHLGNLRGGRRLFRGHGARGERLPSTAVKCVSGNQVQIMTKRTGKESKKNGENSIWSTPMSGVSGTGTSGKFKRRNRGFSDGQYTDTKTKQRKEMRLRAGTGNQTPEDTAIVRREQNRNGGGGEPGQPPAAQHAP